MFASAEWSFSSRETSLCYWSKSPSLFHPQLLKDDRPPCSRVMHLQYLKTRKCQHPLFYCGQGLRLTDQLLWWNNSAAGREREPGFTGNRLLRGSKKKKRNLGGPAGINPQRFLYDMRENSCEVSGGVRNRPRCSTELTQRLWLNM